MFKCTFSGQFGASFDFQMGKVLFKTRNKMTYVFFGLNKTLEK